jgi:sulfide dehydrogenase cytochrome subunit
MSGQVLKKIGACAALVIGVLAMADPGRAAPADGALLAESCGPCHGSGGVGAGPSVPSLAGQPQAYFITAMKRFRSGERPSTVMRRLALGYSDAEIEAMGAYYAARKSVPQPGPAESGPQAKRGIKVSYEKCRTCHLDGSLWKQFHGYRSYDKDCNKSCHLNYGSDGGDIPLIGGQWPAFLEMEMEDFKSGLRKMSERKAKYINSVSLDDLKAAARFYGNMKDLER